MKRILAMLAMVALVVAPVLAEEAAAVREAAKEGAPAADAAKDVTLKGKITKTETEGRDGKKVLTFTLATADAKIDLPARTEIKDDVLNVEVEVVAKAVTGADKKVTVKEVVSIKKVEVKAEAKAEVKEAAKEHPAAK